MYVTITVSIVLKTLLEPSCGYANVGFLFGSGLAAPAPDASNAAVSTARMLVAMV